jgi:hypothetical protein
MGVTAEQLTASVHYRHNIACQRLAESNDSAHRERGDEMEADIALSKRAGDLGDEGQKH